MHGQNKQIEKNNICCGKCNFSSILAHFSLEKLNKRLKNKVQGTQFKTKFYGNVFSFVFLTTLGTLIEFWLVGSLGLGAQRFYYWLYVH